MQTNREIRHALRPFERAELFSTRGGYLYVKTGRN